MLALSASHAFYVSPAVNPVVRSSGVSLFAETGEAQSRRDALKIFGATAASAILLPPIQPASSDSNFTPGGTLVDRDVGVQVGNPEASPSRNPNNSNVLFAQDQYFKFGNAAPWIEPGSTEFPKQMPFVLSQQRYDQLKKYGAKVMLGVEAVEGLGEIIKSTPAEEYRSKILPPDAPEYYLRPMGLLANGFLASENTGTTNELFLARWYINEVYLDIGDMRAAKSKEGALKPYEAAKKAINSYYGMMNRVITAKVGDKFDLLQDVQY